MKSPLNPTSYLSSLEQLYQLVDSTIQTHYIQHPDSQSAQPCKKGCDACCSQFFEISEGESIYILRYLATQTVDFQKNAKSKIEEMYHRFLTEYPKFYATYFENSESEAFDYEAYFDDSTRFTIRIPCPFVSSDGACSIYDARPMICRTTGSAFTTLDDCGDICEIIPSSLLAQKWQADLSHFQEDIWNINELLETKEDETIIELRQFPLFYLLYDLFCKQPSFETAFNSALLHDYSQLSRFELEKKLRKQLIL